MKRLATSLLLLALPVRAALLAEEENAIKVFKEASPSVVFVINVAMGQDYANNDLAVPQGAGSGFIWDREGHIVTNYHVVQNGDAFLVTLKDKTELKARVVGVEPRKDIAVLRVEGPVDKMKPLPLGRSETLQVGQQAVAIGNPFGLDETMTTGIVSALGRKVMGIGGVTIHDMIQTDAAINPGNSGGPLLDSSGALIGMNTVIFSRSGSSAGIGFAVPVSYIRRIVPQLIKDGLVNQPGIGVSILSEEQKYGLLGETPGVIIRDVNAGTPAAKAGLRGLSRGRGGRLALGDIIVAVDGKTVRDYDELYYALDKLKVGDVVAFSVVRGGVKRVVKIELVNVF